MHAVRGIQKALCRHAGGIVRSGIRTYVSRTQMKKYGGEQFEKSFGYCSVVEADNKDPNTRVVDMRSDTVSMPTDEMRQAMAEAVVGDDVYLEDPTVTALEIKAAEMFGKESALFVPSGTMGNLISVMIHCQERGSEAIVGDKCHIFKYEQGGISQFGGIHVKVIPNLKDGTFLLDDVMTSIRTDDIHYPRTKVLCLENTHNICGGKVLPLAYIDKITQFARKHGIPSVHMDGARIFNAAAALNVPVSRILENVDSVSCCLSKGLCAPVGSIIAGTDRFVSEARRLRKALGGGMRQVGHLAAAGLISLEKMVLRLVEDHRRAQHLAQSIAALKSPFFTVDLPGTHSNIVMIDLQTDRVPPEVFCKRLVSVTDAEKTHLGQSVLVRLFPFGNHVARAVICNNLTDEDIDLAIGKLQYFAQELQH
ncbi:putative low-specificity L-threonine aldolase 2 [Hypsibius exemplaris]|uniref:Low-specificity L-threonine aldolase 2 n=1 Tax=Hypsibius exemplaris TaxID=2072580 RepID=A0A1W0XEX0_HYPEX|nr:putative low-specificity L-threonine aldolase 2 [Hypsibius exemplaris]